MSRMTDIAMMLLPQPLSPTSPRVVFRFRVRLIPSNARTVLFSRKKYVLRFLISRIGLDLFTGAWLMRRAFPSSGKKSKHRVESVPAHDLTQRFQQRGRQDWLDEISRRSHLHA